MIGKYFISRKIKKREEILPPSIQVQSVNNITAETASAELVITENPQSVTEAGFVFSPLFEPTIEKNEGIISQKQTPSFFVINPEIEKTITVNPGMTYSIKAYAKYDGGIAYSDVFYFDGVPIKLQSPGVTYLTYSGNPQSSIDVMYTAFTDEYPESDISSEEAGRNVYYRKVGEQDWQNLTSTLDRWPYTGSLFERDEMFVCRAQIIGLDPNSEYEYKIGDSGNVHKFTTIRDSEFDTHPLKVIFAGDIQHSSWQTLTQRKVEQNPDFIVLGGDNAAADGEESQFDRWPNRMWDGVLPLLLKESDNNQIPVVPQIGNHEVIGGFSGLKHFEAAPYHYTAFPWHKEIGGYGTLDIPSILSIFLMNTHGPSVDDQAKFLRETLPVKKQNHPHCVVSEHVSAYPVVRDFSAGAFIRKKWIPHYEANGVRLVFEGHEHVYHRTETLLNGQINTNGIRYYLVDWGTSQRSPVNYRTTPTAHRTYGLTWVEGDEPDPTDGDSAFPERKRNFALCYFYPDKFIVESIIESGESLDTYEKYI